MDLRRLDGIEKTKINSSDKQSAMNVSRYEHFLKEECKISFHMYVDKESKVLKWRDLTGPEKLKLFHKIDISSVFPGIPHATLVQKLWKDFLSIYKTLCLKSVNKTQIKEFQAAVRNWLSMFLSVYYTKHVTPYIHTLVFHVPEFLNLYGS